uniref:Alternative protein N4BP2 n=1 Tax=Homo sapiens TaxID=9606 RepID=L8E8U9_HUMAN|nr:alternative protein N4BP2 [Homo sapiens]
MAESHSVMMLQSHSIAINMMLIKILTKTHSTLWVTGLHLIL